MATPYISGLAALLIQRLYADGLLEGSPAEKDERQDDVVKLVLMNTAVPADNSLADDASYFSPIQQGAGVANIVAALRDFVTVQATGTNDTTADGKLEVKTVGDTFDASFDLTNYGETPVTYNVEYVLLKDNADDNDRYTETTGIAQKSYQGQVTVNAGERTALTVTVPTFDVAANQYVQGYFFFTDVAGDAPTLSVPFLGFKGDWNDLPFLDGLEASGQPVNFPSAHGTDSDGLDTVTNQTGFLYRDIKGNFHFWDSFNVNGQPTVFVNSQDKRGFYNEVVPNVSFLRNAKNVSFTIKDAAGNTIRTLALADAVPKVNQLYVDPNGVRTLDPARSWNFKDFYDNPVADGVYTYEIKGKIDTVDSTPQTYSYQIIVDNEAPTLHVTQDGDYLIVDASDMLAGVAESAILDATSGLIDRHPVVHGDGPLVTRAYQQLAIPTHFKREQLRVVALDNAGNGRLIDLVTGEEETDVKWPKLSPVDLDGLGEQLGEAGGALGEMTPPLSDELPMQEIADRTQYSEDTGILAANLPVMVVGSPGQFEFLNWQDTAVNVSGYFSNLKAVHRVEMTLTDENGTPLVDHAVLPTFEVLVPDDTNEPDAPKLYQFKGTVDLPAIDETHVYHLDIRAFGETMNGQLAQEAIGRTLIVDRQAPEVWIERVIGPNPDRAYFLAYFADDSNALHVTANHSEIVNTDRLSDSLLPLGIQKVVAFDVPLEQGENHIFFTIGDASENNTYELKIINHASEAVDDGYYVKELQTKISKRPTTSTVTDDQEEGVIHEEYIDENTWNDTIDSVISTTDGMNQQYVDPSSGDVHEEYIDPELPVIEEVLGSDDNEDSANNGDGDSTVTEDDTHTPEKGENEVKDPSTEETPGDVTTETDDTDQTDNPKPEPDDEEDSDHVIDSEFNHLNGQPIVPEDVVGTEATPPKDAVAPSAHAVIATTQRPTVLAAATKDSAHTATTTSSRVSQEVTTPQPDTLPQTGFSGHLLLGMASLFGGLALTKRRKK